MYYYIAFTIAVLFILNYLKKIIFPESVKLESGKVFNLSDFDYEPITYESCIRLLESIQKRLFEIGYDKSPLFSNHKKIPDRLKRILDHADKSCCGQIRSNGYYSMGKLIFRYLECVNDELSPSNERNVRQVIQTFNIFSDLLLKLIGETNRVLKDTDLEDEQKEKELDKELLKYPEFQRHLKMYRRVEVTKQTSDDLASSGGGNLFGTLSSLVNYNVVNNSFSKTAEGQKFNSLPLFSPHLSTVCDSSYEIIAQANTKHKEIIYRKYFFFWIDKGLVPVLKNYATFLPFLRMHLYEYPMLFFNSKYRSESINRILR